MQGLRGILNTRIGHINEEEGFANVLSGGTVEVTFGAGE